MAEAHQVPGGRRIIIGSKNMGLPDINLKSNFNTINTNSRNTHARASSMLDNYQPLNMGNKGMQNNFLESTPGLKHKLS